MDLVMEKTKYYEKVPLGSRLEQLKNDLLNIQLKPVENDRDCIKTKKIRFNRRYP